MVFVGVLEGFVVGSALTSRNVRAIVSGHRAGDKPDLSEPRLVVSVETVRRPNGSCQEEQHG